MVPTDRVEDVKPEGLPRMCRDAVALCHITAGAKANCHHEQGIAVCNSDYFEAVPISFRPDGFVVVRPGLLAFNGGMRGYHPALPTYLGTPRENEFRLDDYLLNAFRHATEALLHSEKVRELRQVFRAVALAMHASRILRETHSWHEDLTPRLVCWTAAFETLVHDTDRSVGLKDVLSLVRRIQWHDESPTRKGPDGQPISDLAEATCSIGGKEKQPEERENAPSNFYRRLYDLRNDLAHGNQIDPAKFSACRTAPNGPHVQEIVPLLFRECALERLRDLKIVERIQDDANDVDGWCASVSARWNAREYHNTLAKALLGRSHVSQRLRPRPHS